MPACARLGDQCSGHDCFPPRPNTGGSSDVFINNIASHRVGDPWAVHACGSSNHGSALGAGSGSVFVNGRPMGRIGDSVACGSAVAQGSQNVFAGG